MDTSTKIIQAVDATWDIQFRSRPTGVTEKARKELRPDEREEYVKDAQDCCFDILTTFMYDNRTAWFSCFDLECIILGIDCEPNEKEAQKSHNTMQRALFALRLAGLVVCKESEFISQDFSDEYETLYALKGMDQ